MSEQALTQDSTSTEVQQDEVVVTTLLAPGAAQPAPQKKKKRAAIPADRRPAMKLPEGANGTTRQATERQKPSAQGQKPEPGAFSKRAQTHRNMLAFMPIANHPAELHDVVLVTEYTQKLFADHYGRAQISLYNLMTYLVITLRRMGLTDEKANDFVDSLEDAIDARICDLASRMKAELARVEKIARDNQLKPVQVRSGKLVRTTLPELTPQIVDFLGYLPVLDAYVCTLDVLWIQRLVKRRDRDELINKFRNEITSLARLTMRLYWESKRLAQEGDLDKMTLSVVDKVVTEIIQLDPEEEAQAQAMTKTVSDHLAGNEFATAQ